MDRRAVAALVAGLGALASGVAGLFLDVPALGAVAGAAGLAAATLAIALGASLRASDAARVAAEARADGLESRTAELAVEAGELRRAAQAGDEASKMAATLAEMVALRAEIAADEEPLLDDATGLLDGRYFEPALQSRVAAARRLLRPVTIVLLQLDPDRRVGTDEREATTGAFAAVLRQTLREADTACRIDESRFGLILEDTPEGGGVWAAERIRAGFARGGGPVQLLSAGVAAYPSHALDADELLDRAERALTRARASGRGQVEVAAAD